MVLMQRGLSRFHKTTASLACKVQIRADLRAFVRKSAVCRAESTFVSQLSEDEHKQTELYLDNLLECNEKFNLTAIKSKEEAYSRHIEDSLALLPTLGNFFSLNSAHLFCTSFLFSY